MTDLAPALRKRPRDRKDRIVAAAAARFGTAGFRATSVEDIASDVGVTAGAIYRHFESKDDLLSTVVAKATDALLLDTTEALAQSAVDDSGGDAALRALVKATVRFAAASPALYATFVREHRGPTGPIAEATMRNEARITEQWHAAVRQSDLRLDDARIDVRLDSALAALREMALSADPGDLDKHESLVCEALVAMWRSPVRRTKPAGSPPEPRFRPPVLRSQQILVAALTLFRERGFHDVGMEDIAAAVGMVASGLYRFYPSKSDMLLDAYDLAVAHVIAGMDAVLAQARDVEESLEGLIRLQVQTARSVIDLIVVTAREGAALPEAERPRLARRRRQILETHVAVLRQARPWLSEAEARILLFGLQPLIRTAAMADVDMPDPVAELVGMGLALLSAKPPTSA